MHKLNSNTSQNVKQIDELSLKKIKVSQEREGIDNQISLKEKQIQALNILKIKLQGVQEKQNRIQEIEKSNTFLTKDAELLNKQLDVLKSGVLELSKFDNLFKEKQKYLDETLKQEKIAEIKFAELKKEIEVFSRYMDELKERIKQTEEIKNQLNYLVDLDAWLSKQFVAMMSSIEKNVMNKLKSEFSRLFSEWFSMLVSDNFNVHLDDNFTPIVELQDYVVDYAYLSGGERTAIALAYRLALNQVINSLLSNIKTKGLIILDEPTDGFSDAQLDKMRNVLEQLNVTQLIIVSHEQKIESFVENVIRFRKEKGISVVEG